ncbi:MAG: hypothetical protein HYY44_02620 [Deltaproteobacteria bacterium]|nr:hypothetical protein [Deltaproteobacteria bacterium]
MYGLYGDLSCTRDCRFDFSTCSLSDPYGNPATASPLPPETGCHNFMIDGEELCDEGKTGGLSCATYGYFAGTLSCQSDCDSFNTGDCYGRVGDPNATTPPPEDTGEDGFYVAQCGNNFIDEGEVCETNLRASLQSLRPSCSSLGYFGGVTLCLSGCSGLETRSCYGLVGDPYGGPYGSTPPATDPYYTARCGNSFLDAGEACEWARDRTTVLPIGQSCATQGFDYGSLSCISCRWDTRGCHNEGDTWCGDGIINREEECEGSGATANLNGETCVTRGFAGRRDGTTGLGCVSTTCRFNTVNCCDVIVDPYGGGTRPCLP